MSAASPPLPLTCTVPRSFAPSRSLLGRLVRVFVADARQSEGAYWVAAAVLSAAGVLAGHWAWLALAGSVGLAEALVATSGGLALAAFAFAGWQPALTVTLDGRRLRVRRGREALDVHRDVVATMRRVSAAEAHGHWLRYAATRAFVNRLHAELLLLRTTDGTPLLIGLPPTELERFEAALTSEYVSA